MIQHPSKPAVYPSILNETNLKRPRIQPMGPRLEAGGTSEGGFGSLYLNGRLFRIFGGRSLPKTDTGVCAFFFFQWTLLVCVSLVDPPFGCDLFKGNQAENRGATLGGTPKQDTPT